MVKALFFDVFGTVVDWRNSIAREAERFAAAGGISLDGEAFALAWRRRYVPAMKRVRSGERGFVPLDVLHRENLLEVLEEFGIGQPDGTVIDHLSRAWHRLAPWPDSVPGLQRLKRGFILATMSNGNVALMVNLARHAELPWDMILGAEIARTYKPEPETYLTGCRLLDLAPGECMMVAAHNADLLAARDLGLKTAFIARPTEYGPAQGTDLEAEHDFDVIAESMEDLAGRLGC